MVEGLIVATPNMLDPAGSEAHRLAGVWWLLLAMATAVAVLVLGLIVVGLFRRGDAADADGGEGSDQRDHRFIFAGGLVLPVVVLSIVAVVTVTTVSALRQHKPDEVKVDVEGEQWFWRVRYPESGVTSANLIRLPVDRPVVVTLHSDDVIHSFWVPRLAGKLDVIPGQTNRLRFTPTEVGRFRGECAEFCGLQHANMAFEVRVMDGAAYDRWIARRQRRSSSLPTALAREGQRVFAQQSCAGCHAIRGVSDGQRGPDLSDFGSRPALGAGVVPNTKAHLADWIRNAPGIKPGVNMPPIALTDREVKALVAYLEALP